MQGLVTLQIHRCVEQVCLQQHMLVSCLTGEKLCPAVLDLCLVHATPAHYQMSFLHVSAEAFWVKTG
jgi:hypothetical protein